MQGWSFSERNRDANGVEGDTNAMKRNLLKYGLGEVLAKLAPFLSAMYVAAVLPPSRFGSFSLLLVLFEISFILISFNIQAVTRIDYFKVPDNQFFAIKYHQLTLSTMAAIALAAVSMCQDALSPILAILIMVAALLRTVSTMVLAIHQCSKSVGDYQRLNLTFFFSLAALTILFIHWGAQEEGWVYALITASTIQFVVAVWQYKGKFVKTFLAHRFRKSTFVDSFWRAAVFFPQALGWWVKGGVDRLIIAGALGMSTLGLFALASQISSVVLVGVGAVNLTIVPDLNLAIRERNRKKIRKIMAFSIGMIVVGILITQVSGRILVSSLYVESYQDSMNILPWVLVSIFPQAIALVKINILYFCGMGAFVARVIFGTFVLQGIINYLVAPAYGLIGMIICSGMMNVVMLSLVSRKISEVYRTW